MAAPPREQPSGRAGGLGGRAGQQLIHLRGRAKPTMRDRVRDVRLNAALAVQAGAAAVIAWVVSHNILGNSQPVFAPIIAVSTLASSAGERLRRVVEVVIGIAMGIAVGDLLVLLIGTGPWQIGLIVVLSVVITVFLGGNPAVVTQAAATAVLIVALRPVIGNIEQPRVIDAAIGGAAGLLVGLLLLPLNPIRVVVRVVNPTLDALSYEIGEAAAALQNGDELRARKSLRRMRELQDELPALHEAIEAGRETSRFSPLRWRKRADLRRYADSAQYLHRVTHNSGGMVRRLVTLIEDRERVPHALPEALRLLGESIRVLHHELAAGLEPQAAREWALRAVSHAGRAYEEQLGLSGGVVVAQVRTIVSDVLRASGVDSNESAANGLVREAIRRTVGRERADLAGAAAATAEPPETPAAGPTQAPTLPQAPTAAPGGEANPPQTAGPLPERPEPPAAPPPAG